MEVLEEENSNIDMGGEENEVTDDYICNLLMNVTTPAQLRAVAAQAVQNKREEERNRARKRCRDEENDFSNSDEDDCLSDIEEGDDDDGFNIETHESKNKAVYVSDPKKLKTVGPGKEDMIKIELEKFIDPIHLVTRDSIKYIHLSEGSNKLPSSNHDTFQFPKERKYPQRDSSNSVYYDCHSVWIDFDMKNERFGVNSPRWKDCAVPDANSQQQYPMLKDSVIKGIPVRSPLYTYELVVYRKKNADKDKNGKLGNYKLWYVESCKMNRKHLTADNIEFFVYHCAGYTGDIAESFKNEFNRRYPDADSGSTARFRWDDYQNILKTLNLTKRMHDRPIPEVMRYIFNKEIRILEEFYHEIVLLNMHPRHIQSLYKRVAEDPFDLFFFKLTNFKFRITKVLKDRKKDVDKNGVTTVDVDETEHDFGEGEDDREDAENMSLKILLDSMTFNRDLIVKTYFNFDEGLEVFWLHIPEINNKHLSKLSRVFTKRQIATINIYQAMRQSYHTSFNCFEYPWVLKSYINYMHGDGIAQEFSTIMNWLCTTPLKEARRRSLNSYQPTLVKEYKGFYYLAESYLYMKVVIESFMLLFDRYADRVSLDMDVDDKYDELRLNVGYEVDKLVSTSTVKYMNPFDIDINLTSLTDFCSEQLKASLLFKNAPVIMVCGGGGSGKSYWVHKIKKCVKDDEALLLSFQGRNVAPFTDEESFGPRALTIHNFLYMHKKCCVTDSWSTGNHFRKNQSTEVLNDFTRLKECNGICYKRCIWEKIKVVVFEEFSMASMELFSLALCVLMRCSQLERIVMCGDHRQCTPIGPGQPMKDLKKMCDEMGLTVEFTHNHRTDNKVIHHNGLEIAKGNYSGIQIDNQSVILDYFTCEYSKDKRYMYGSTLKEVVSRYKVPHYQSTILAHTNNIVDSINPVIEAFYLGLHCDESNYLSICWNYHEGTKAMFKMNLYLFCNVLINNELFIVQAIQDFKPLDKKQKKSPNYFVKSLKNNEEFRNVPNTSAQRTIPHCRRRLIVTPLDHIAKLGNVEEKYVPFFGLYRNKLKKAYATTIQGSQGGEFDDVIIFAPFKSDAWTREMMYTAWSRAKKRVIFVGDPDALEAAVNNPERERNSCLSISLTNALQHRVPDGWKKWNPSNEFGGVYDEVKMIEELGDVDEQFADLDDNSFSVTSNRSVAHMKPYYTEIILALIEYGSSLPFEDIYYIYKLRRVSRDFKNAIDSKQMWIGIYEINCKYTHNSFKWIINKTPDELSAKYDRIKEGNVLSMYELTSYVLNSIGKSVYICQHKCNNGFNDTEKCIINSTTILSSLWNKFSDKVAYAKLKGFSQSLDRQRLTIPLKICPCGATTNCSIWVMKTVDTEIYPGGLKGFHVDYAEIKMTPDNGFIEYNVSDMYKAHPREYRALRAEKLDISKKKIQVSSIYDFFTRTDTSSSQCDSYNKTSHKSSPPRRVLESADIFPM